MNGSTKAIKLFETEHWEVLINPDQQNLGKSLVILKADKSSLAQLSELEWKEFGEITKKLEEALAVLFKPTHFNWQCLMNNAFKTDSPEKPHVHWHVSPRYAESVWVENVEFVDENYPRTNKEAKIIDKDHLGQIARLIQAELSIDGDGQCRSI